MVHSAPGMPHAAAVGPFGIGGAVVHDPPGIPHSSLVVVAVEGEVMAGAGRHVVPGIGQSGGVECEPPTGGTFTGGIVRVLGPVNSVAEATGACVAVGPVSAGPACAAGALEAAGVPAEP
jgi:hypothetical protein